VNKPYHELALIHYGTSIGEGTRIWAFASVQPGAQIGERCTIGEAVHIGPHVKIGNGCKIQNGAQLFEGVTLEDDVFIGPHVVFTNVTTPRAFISRRAEFKPTLVKRGASIGANVTVLCGITIGEYAMIGAGAVVTKDVAPHRLMTGVPAEHAGYVCTCGVRLRRVYSWDSWGTPSDKFDCPSCSNRYLIAFGEVRPVDGP